MNRSITSGSVSGQPSSPSTAHVHLDREALGVDQHPVAVEDHELGRPRAIRRLSPW